MTREEAKKAILDKAKNDKLDKYGQTIHLLSLHTIVEQIYDAHEAELKKVCEILEGAKIIYDSIGVGAGTGSNISKLNQEASNRFSANVEYAKFAASGSVIKPKKEYEHGVTNKDMFSNLKAQAWWSVANRLRNTYNAIQNGDKFSPDEMISISSDLPQLEAIKAQLSTPRQDRDNSGKVMVESKKELKKRGVASPNLADAVVMAFSENLVGFKTKNSYGGAGSRTF